MNIDNLPPEILCKIFDHLNIEDVKNASLSCQRWKALIFGSPYIKRFRLNLDLEWFISGGLSVFANDRANYYRNLLPEANGNRDYHHAIYTVDDPLRPQPGAADDDRISRMIPLFALPLRTLRLKSFYYPSSILLPFLAQQLQSMQHLNHLILELCAPENVQEALLFQSNTVQQIELTFHAYDLTMRDHHGGILRLEMPNLRSYKGTLDILDRSTTGLTELTLTSGSWPRRYENFEANQTRLSALVSLVKLTIDFVLNDGLFRAICQSCPTLQELVLKRNVVLSDVTIFEELNQLKRLTHLEMVSFRGPKTGKPVDLRPLTQLSYLELTDDHFAGRIKVTFPHGIKKLKVHPFGLVFESHQMKVMCAEMKQLTDLLVTFCLRSPYLTNSMLLAVCSIRMLERLTITYGTIRKESFVMLAELPSLRLIRFVNCIVDMTFPDAFSIEMRLENCLDVQMRPIPNGRYIQ